MSLEYSFSFLVPVSPHYPVVLVTVDRVSKQVPDPTSRSGKVLIKYDEVPQTVLQP